MRVSLDQSRAACFAKEGTTSLRGKKISYKVISEDTYFDNSAGVQAASFFSYSYFRTDVKDAVSRPVIFAFNGGPGSSSIWVHVGFFGVDRIKYDDPVHPPVTPPFEVEPNPHCFLDIADVVVIDPVATGYSDVIDAEAAKEFYSTEADALAFTLFIEHWLSKYGRWNSPRFLCGESYGTVRNGMLAGAMVSSGGALKSIPVNGILMLGPILNVMPSYNPQFSERSVTDFLCMAATNHYHHPKGKPSLEEFAEEAWDFASGEYLRALFLCDCLPKKEYDAVVKKLTYYTGVSEKYIREHHLRIAMNDFLSEVVPGQVVGLYDSRYTLPENNRIGQFDVVPDDGAMGQYTSSYVGVFNDYFKPSLGITFDRAYIPINFGINATWNWEVARTPSDNLTAAMRRNKDLHVFWGTGYYDLCTTPGGVRHFIAQSGMPLERVTRKEYPSGHMPYLGEDSCIAMDKDIREFIAKALKK